MTASDPKSPWGEGGVPALPLRHLHCNLVASLVSNPPLSPACLPPWVDADGIGRLPPDGGGGCCDVRSRKKGTLPAAAV